MSTLTQTMHPEDIKAAIRKRHGSVNAFVSAMNLPTTGVSDFFRGRPSKRVADAIEQLLQDQSPESKKMDCSSRAA